MAKLPSQSDTALAFAEVFMVIEMLFEQTGVDGINRLLDTMKAGRTDREAVEELAKKSFRRFQREWKNYLYNKNLRTLPVHSDQRLLFRDSAEASDELKEIPQERARQYAYLKDRLLGPKRFLAAQEYESADARRWPKSSDKCKLAGALLKQGKHKPVAAIVTPALGLNQVMSYYTSIKERLGWRLLTMKEPWKTSNR